MNEGATQKLEHIANPELASGNKTNPIDRLNLSFRPPIRNPVCQNKAKYTLCVSRRSLWQEIQNKAKIMHYQLKNRDCQKTNPNDRLNLSSRTEPVLAKAGKPGSSFTKRTQMESRNHEKCKTNPILTSA
jgi:hypothetical protein